MRPNPVPVETLLGHRAFVRDLARTLVRDEHAADDLEQEAWAAALRTPPADGNVRGWLATVLRNAAKKRTRAETRRAHHEHVRGPGDDLPPVADTVARAETHRRLVEAVMALPDVQRDAVLLRFFDGLPPREVARRTGVPVATVRTRLRRALLALRERLDASYGDRGSWRPALLLLCGDLPKGGGASASGGTAIGASVMAISTNKVLVAAAVVLLGVGLWWGLRSGGDGPPARVVATSVPDDPTDAGSPVPSDADTAAARAGRARRGPGERAEQPEEGTAPEVPEVAAPEPVLRVSLARADGGSLEGARLLFVTGGRVTWSAYVDEGKVPTGPVPASDGKLVVALFGVTVQAKPVAAGAQDVALDLVTEPLLAGLVRIDGAEPGAPLTLDLEPEVILGEDMPEAPDAVPHAAWEALRADGYGMYREMLRVDAAGRFALAGRISARSVWVACPHGMLDRETRDDGRSVRLPQRDLQLDLIRLPMVKGRVVDDAGKPVAFAQVEVNYGTESGGGGSGTEADESGRFEVPLPVDEAVKGECTVSDPDGVVSRTFPFALRPGGSHAFGDLALPRVRTIRLRALDGAEAPLGRAVGMAPAGEGIAAPSEPAADDGVVRIPAAAGPSGTVFLGAPGHRVAAVDGTRLSGDEVVDVRLEPASRLEVRPPAGVDVAGWTLHVGFAAGAFGRADDGTPADDAALLLHAACGASRFRGGGFGATSSRVSFELLPTDGMGVGGAPAGAELVLELKDAAGQARGTTRVTLGVAEQRKVELRAEAPTGAPPPK